jgi:hypothetical protein
MTAIEDNIGIGTQMTQLEQRDHTREEEQGSDAHKSYGNSFTDSLHNCIILGKNSKYN